MIQALKVGNLHINARTDKVFRDTSVIRSTSHTHKLQHTTEAMPTRVLHMYTWILCYIGASFVCGGCVASRRWSVDNDIPKRNHILYHDGAMHIWPILCCITQTCSVPIRQIRSTRFKLALRVIDLDLRLRTTWTWDRTESLSGPWNSAYKLHSIWKSCLNKHA